ncbi:putative receptor-like protein kinase At2g23200 [Bidens hawaiensis]|uniref:putative receptor-like protein kinase At2g23200 n=1 Tax=Bidens hawaiensis TaxID=980011 RepID=UPI0040495D29
MESTLSFPLIILFHALSLVSSQSQYTLPNNYFINCGSNSDIDFTGKIFIGDENRPTFKFSKGSKAVNNNPVSDIYQTARVFTKKSSYELEADQNNTFVMVNLHFSPFFYNGIELSDSEFDVSVSGFLLLSNFNVGNSTVIKNFIIPIGEERKFTIEFTPSSGSSPAFINAIEAFVTPSDLFVHDTTSTHVSPLGKIGDIGSISSYYAFNPVYRINVGGQSIDTERDTLRRTWIPDDPFIIKSEPAENVTGSVNYDGWATRFDAPADVYNTAKRLKPNSSSVNNITWSFMVNKSAMYLVRAHFCDINSTGLNDPNDAFNFFIYGQYGEPIKPGDTVGAMQIPFYHDFVVDSVDSGFVNVSIGSIPNISQPVLLNGLEIMELLKGSGVVDIGNNGKNNKKVYIVVGCVLAGLVFVLLIGFFIGFKYKKTKSMVGTKTESNAMPSNGRSSYTSINIDFTVNNMSPIPNLNLNLQFRFSDILQATNNFDEKLVIGKGGFGKVYRGTLPDGKTVAVKRGEIGHGQGWPEFVTEIMVLSKIRHQHLVTLIGYCDERSEMILVYEYMEKGTLQDHLYDTNKDVVKLSWSKRLEICISATRGLHYLHTGSDAGIIHRDVKSTNILLNENYIAKVADFGISRLGNLEESVMDIKGSFGYLDPEYISCMKLTQKSDVYSFGVVLLEVLCARPALDNTLPQKEANLADWALKRIKDGMVEKIIDPYIVDQINPNSLRKYVETVERCLKNTGDERPSMIDVLWDLEYALKLQQMVVDKEPYDDSTMNTSLQLSMSTIDRLPSKCNDDDSQVIDTSFPSESQVFSQLKMDEAR